MRASLGKERAGHVDKKWEGDSSSRWQSLQIASPDAAFVVLYLKLDASIVLGNHSL